MRGRGFAGLVVFRGLCFTETFNRFRSPRATVKPEVLHILGFLLFFSTFPAPPTPCVGLNESYAQQLSNASTLYCITSL